MLEEIRRARDEADNDDVRFAYDQAQAAHQTVLYQHQHRAKLLREAEQHRAAAQRHRAWGRHDQADQLDRLARVVVGQADFLQRRIEQHEDTASERAEFARNGAKPPRRSARTRVSADDQDREKADDSAGRSEKSD